MTNVTNNSLSFNTTAHSQQTKHSPQTMHLQQAKRLQQLKHDTTTGLATSTTQLLLPQTAQ